MSNAIHAAEQLRNFGNKIKPIIEAVEYLESLGNLQQAESEANGRKEQAKKDSAVAVNQLQALESQIQEAEGKAKSFEVIAEQTKLAAVENAKKIIETAEDEAKKVFSECRTRKAEYETIIEKKRLELSDLETSKVSRKEELAKLEETIRQTKARISAL